MRNGRPIHTLNPAERAELQDELASILPAWAYWDISPARVTWTNQVGVWCIEFDWGNGTMTTSIGNNRWISTTWNLEWKRTWLAHHGAFE